MKALLRRHLGTGIGVLWALWMAWTWARPALLRQDQVLATILASLAASMAWALWFFVFSEASGRRKRFAAAAAVAVLALLAASVRVTGVTGDVRPILSWRWAGAPVSSSASRLVTTKLDLDVSPTLADSHQFLGARRNGVIDGVQLQRDWVENAPREIWRRPIGAGWGSFAVQGDIAVTQEQRGDEELVVAYALDTGEPVWSHADTARYEAVPAGLGPRATPTIDGLRVFSMGATGILNALDLSTGELLWRHDVVTETGARVPAWGKSCSPLVHDGKVIVSAGGPAGKSLLAYATDTGELLWSAGDDASGYASPLLTTLAGVPQVVIFNHSTVAAHDPDSGTVLWEYPWPRQQPNVAQPLPVGDTDLIVSSGYGIGARRLRVGRDADGRLGATLVWESIRLKSKFAHFFLYKGSLYGLDDGVLASLDPDSGERHWKRGRYGHGQMLLVEGLLLIQAENGDLVLVQPDPSGLGELARVPALNGNTWNVPTLVGNRLLLRNAQEAVMLQLATR